MISKDDSEPLNRALKECPALQVPTPSTFADYTESIKFINNFFNEFIIPNMLARKWNLCIIVADRGAQIFKDQQLSNTSLQSLNLICIDPNEDDLDGYSSSLEGKSVVIFNEGINKGNEIRDILGFVKQLASDLTVATLISREGTIISLKSDYPQVKFECALETPKDKFEDIYHKLIHPYLACTCLPLQHDHPISSIGIKGPFEENTIRDILDPHGILVDADRLEYKMFYGDRYKKVFFYKEEILNAMPIIRLLRIAAIIPPEVELNKLLKIRLYLRKGEINWLLVQPISLLEYDIPSDGKKIDSLVKSQLLIDVLILILNSNKLNISKLNFFDEKKIEFTCTVH